MALEAPKYFSQSLIGIDASTGGISSAVEIPSNNAITIQQTSAATGTATIQVSSDSLKWDQFNVSSTNYDFVHPVVIYDGYFPWRFLRVSVNPGGSGTAAFLIQQRL